MIRLRIKRKTRHFFILALCSCLLLCLGGCHNNSESKLVVLDEKSLYEDFEIFDNQVTIFCSVTVQNDSKHAKEFQMLADFTEDVKTGLLTEANLVGYQKDTNRDTFKIEGEQECTYQVVFTGDFAGTMKIENRNLPKIELIEIEDILE